MVKKRGYHLEAAVDGGKKGKMRITSEHRMGPFKRFLLTAIIIIVILMVTFVFVSRTEGFRDLLQSSLSKRLGVELEIEKTRVGFPYVIVMENISTKEAGIEKAGWITIDEVRLGLGIRTPLKISVKRATLNLVESLNGEWVPAMFSRLGDLPLKNVAEISRITESFRKKVGLRISECSINWVPVRNLGVTAGGISFEVVPVNMPGDGMFYHRLLVYNVPGEGDSRFKDVERIWLANDDNRYIELEKSEGRVPEYAREFWEKEHFKQYEKTEVKKAPEAEKQRGQESKK